MDVDLWSVGNLVLLGTSIISGIISFFVFVFYFNEDARYERSYRRYYQTTRKSASFPYIEGIEPKNLIISSSDVRFSRFRAGAKALLRKYEREDVTLVPFREETEQADKEKWILVEAVSGIPGKFLLSTDFRESLVNYQAFKLSLEDSETPDSVKGFFASSLETSTWGPRIANLDRSETLQKASLSLIPESKKSILNEVVLPMVARLWYDVVQTAPTCDRQAIMNELRPRIMEVVFGIYKSKIKIVFVGQHETKPLLSAVTRDVRVENNYGYLLRAEMGFFEAFKSLAIATRNRLDFWWGKGNYHCLSPNPNRTLPHSFDRGTFVCYVKKKERFKRPRIPERLKGKQKYREIARKSQTHPKQASTVLTFL